MQDNMPTTRVLHISDVHLDLSYKVGTNVDCGMPMCCMNFTEMANETSKGAGFWGEYYCDFPVWTFEDMLRQIKDDYSDVSVRNMIVNNCYLNGINIPIKISLFNE